MPHALSRSFPGEDGTLGVELQMDCPIGRGHVKSGRKKELIADIWASKKTVTEYERIR